MRTTQFLKINSGKNCIGSWIKGISGFRGSLGAGVALTHTEACARFHKMSQDFQESVGGCTQP